MGSESREVQKVRWSEAERTSVKGGMGKASVRERGERTRKCIRPGEGVREKLTKRRRK